MKRACTEKTYNDDDDIEFALYGDHAITPVIVEHLRLDAWTMINGGGGVRLRMVNDLDETLIGYDVKCRSGCSHAPDHIHYVVTYPLWRHRNPDHPLWICGARIRWWNSNARFKEARKWRRVYVWLIVASSLLRPALGHFRAIGTWLTWPPYHLVPRGKKE